jgi:hypothetical protein
MHGLNVNTNLFPLQASHGYALAFFTLGAIAFKAFPTLRPIEK